MITTWTAGHPGEWMEEELLTELSAKVWRHPWWHTRSELVIQFLRNFRLNADSSVLDAGCGWGVTLQALERQGYRVTGLDVSRGALEKLDRTDRALIQADVTRPFPNGSPLYDVVMALDVIEHLDDDAAALKNLSRLTKRGGRMIVSVPAGPELFSEFDRIQGHRRRYTPESLREAFALAGVPVDEILWWGQTLTPFVRFQRRMRKQPVGASNMELYSSYLDLPPWPLLYIISGLLRWDAKRTFERRATNGTSLFALSTL